MAQSQDARLCDNSLVSGSNFTVSEDDLVLAYLIPELETYHVCQLAGDTDQRVTPQQSNLRRGSTGHSTLTGTNTALQPRGHAPS